MHIEKLRFYNYRNIENTKISLNKSINIFLGKNGQGKTNILESIFLLINGSAFRPGELKIFVNRNSNDQNCQIEAELNNKQLQQILKFQLINLKKSLTLNNKKINQQVVHQNFKSVLFSPESLSIIKNSAEERRQLVDDFLMVFDFESTGKIKNYRKVLQTRNKVFKDAKKGFYSQVEAQKIIESLNPNFLELGASLTQNRIRVIRQIIPLVQRIFNQISQNNVEISVEYLISSNNGVDWTDSQVYTYLRSKLNEMYHREFEAGITLLGPHKHDIKILVNQEDSRYYCSQGQQRALILSFKMVQVLMYKELYGHYPILLLDDVLSELDYEKRTYLIEFLNGIESQIFITTTDLHFKWKDKEMSLNDPDLLKGDLTVYNITDGQIVKEEKK